MVLHGNKCPHCEKTVATARVENIEINAGLATNKPTRASLTRAPHCRSILGVSMDQLSLNTDLENRIKKLLRK